MNNFIPSRSHDGSGLRFERLRKDARWIELERTQMPEPWLKICADGLGLVGFAAAIIFLLMR